MFGEGAGRLPPPDILRDHARRFKRKDMRDFMREVVVAHVRSSRNLMAPSELALYASRLYEAIEKTVGEVSDE